MAMTTITTPLDQYLKVASYGNVIAEKAVATNRWRLGCQNCGKTLTFVEDYDLSQLYAKDGRLDAGVQQFAKDHRHLKPSHMNKFGNIVFEPEPIKKPAVPALGQGAAFVPTDTKAMLEKYAEAEAAYEKEMAEKKSVLAQELAKKKALINVISVLKTPEPPPRKTEGRKFR